MKIHKITPADRDAMLTSFKPLFGDWDYLPFVIDEWIKPSSHMVTYVVDSEDSDLKLIAMGQAYELDLEIGISEVCDPIRMHIYIRWLQQFSV